MIAVQSDQPFTMERVSADARRRSVAEYVLEGLRDAPRTLPPVLLYDANGSVLFEKICALEDYYPTRTERAILEARAGDIAAQFGSEVSVIELGSGSSEKTEIVLAELLRQGKKVRYTAVDISESALVEAANRLTQDMPQLEVHTMVGEYEDALDRIADRPDVPALFMFLGGNLGNFERADAHTFLQRIEATARPHDRLLLGLDRVKDTNVLIRAYDDSEGVTALFNLNVLRRINAELDADYDVQAFKHVAVWNDELSRIEMHLESLREQKVHIGALDLDVTFAAGERIHTENSHKFTPEAVRALADSAGWRVDEAWTDPKGLFSLNLLAK